MNDVQSLAVVVVVGMLGCGRIAFDERDERSDARADDGGHDAAASCWDAWKSEPGFSTPAPLTELNTDTSSDKNAFLTSDGLTLYFASTRSSTSVDFWRARRPTVTDLFVVEGVVAELNSSADEGRIVTDTAGLFAVVSTRRPGGAGNNDLWLATRADDTSPFVLDRAPTAALDSAGDDKDPQLMSPARRLYFSVNQSEIRAADWNGTSYSASQLIGGLSLVPGAVSISDPQVSPDELVLAFTANTGTGQDFYRTVRTAVTEAFPTASLIAGLSTSVEEQDLSITPDGCEVWFTRADPTDDIWHARVQ